MEADFTEVEADLAEWEATISPPARDVLDEMHAREKKTQPFEKRGFCM